MKKQDTIKVVIAVGCLVLAGVLFFVLNSGGGSAGGTQTIGASAEGGGQGARLTEEEARELADDSDAVFGGGTGPTKPTPRRR